MSREATAEWMAYARGALALASVPPPPGVPLALLCFHAQQAAEKALKAVLVFHDAEVPWTHNIQLLIELIEALELVPPSLRVAAALTEYAVVMRYPGDAEPVTQPELARALGQARAIVEAAEQWTAP